MYSAKTQLLNNITRSIDSAAWYESGAGPALVRSWATVYHLPEPYQSRLIAARKKAERIMYLVESSKD